MTFFRECDASYLETGKHIHIDPIALEDVEAAFRFTKRNTNTLLKQSCKNGSMFMVKKAIEKGAAGWNLGLWGACWGDHRDLIDFMIEKGATDWNRGLRCACLGGQRELADFMIEKGATDWNCGLQGACRGGHRELADLMIEKGATNADILPSYFS